MIRTIACDSDVYFDSDIQVSIRTSEFDSDIHVVPDIPDDSDNRTISSNSDNRTSVANRTTQSKPDFGL